MHNGDMVCQIFGVKYSGNRGEISDGYPLATDASTFFLMLLGICIVRYEKLSEIY